MNQDIKNKEVEIRISRVLTELRELITQGFISKEDILNLFRREKGPAIAQESSHPTARVLYFVGGFIIILGLGIFIFQFWGEWSQSIRVIFALGLSAFLYAVGYYLHHHYPKLLIFSKMSFILSTLLLPLGVGHFLFYISFLIGF